SSRPAHSPDTAGDCFPAKKEPGDGTPPGTGTIHPPHRCRSTGAVRTGRRRPETRKQGSARSLASPRNLHLRRARRLPRSRQRSLLAPDGKQTFAELASGLGSPVAPPQSLVPLVTQRQTGQAQQHSVRSIPARPNRPINAGLLAQIPEKLPPPGPARCKPVGILDQMEPLQITYEALAGILLLPGAHLALQLRDKCPHLGQPARAPRLVRLL